METYGEVPDHHEGENKKVVTALMELVSILVDPTIEEFHLQSVLIAMDTMEDRL